MAPSFSFISFIFFREKENEIFFAETPPCGGVFLIFINRNVENLRIIPQIIIIIEENLKN